MGEGHTTNLLLLEDSGVRGYTFPVQQDAQHAPGVDEPTGRRRGPNAIAYTSKSSAGTKEKKERRKIDAHWKAIIKRFFALALRRILPELADDMDASRKVVFLDKELAELAVFIDGPEQCADVLARVPVKSGRDVWLILHVEIQGPEGGNLPERMFYYNSSLRVTYLKKKEDVADAISFAILTAKRPGGEEDLYLRESYRNRVIYEYPVLKLWELDSDELERSENPFDWALYAGKCALESGRNDRLKVDYLKLLSEKLDSKGWTHEEKLTLFRFTDMLLRPKSPEMRKSYDEYVDRRKKEGKTVFLSMIEENAKKKGEKVGEKRGEAKQKLAFATRMLDRGEPREKILEYAEITPEELDELIKSRRN